MIINRLLNRLGLVRFAQERDGVSALEFALIAPVFLIFGFGTIELASWLRSDRGVTDLAGSLAVAVADIPAINDSEIDAIERAINGARGNLSLSELNFQITSVVNNNNVIEVAWQEAFGEGDTSFNLPETEIQQTTQDGDYAMVVQVAFHHVGYFDRFVPDNTITQTFVSYPARSVAVIRR